MWIISVISANRRCSSVKSLRGGKEQLCEHIYETIARCDARGCAAGSKCSY